MNKVIGTANSYNLLATFIMVEMLNFEFWQKRSENKVGFFIFGIEVQAFPNLPSQQIPLVFLDPR